MENDFPKRKHPRLKDYDYSQNGYYFVTICAANRRCVFGTHQPVGRGLAPAEKTHQPVGRGLAPAENTHQLVGRGLAPAENAHQNVGRGLAPVENAHQNVGRGLAPAENAHQNVGRGLAPAENTHQPVGRGLAPAENAHQTVGRGLAPAAQDGRIVLTPRGEIAKQQLAALEQRYDFVRVDQYVIMPNHIHMILVLEGKAGASPRPTLSDILCAYKSLTTRTCNAVLKTPGEKLFQTSFYEKVIRSDEGYFAACQYISKNPRKWKNDEYYK